MAKQVHLRLDDAVFEALENYTKENQSSMLSLLTCPLIFLRRVKCRRQHGRFNLRYMAIGN